MIRYRISCPNPLNHIVHISLRFELNPAQQHQEISLPLWRPGRYELANYAKNVIKTEAFAENGLLLEIKKKSKSRWVVKTGGARAVDIQYQYFACQMDAGNSWLHDDQLYLNFINCLLYLPDRIEEEVEIELDLPASYSIACSLRKEGQRLFAKDYYEAADSPVIASDQLQHLSYDVDDITFHVWYKGEIDVDINKLLEDFRRFTEPQLALFEGLPTADYHFLFQFLPYRFYHGVEHANSTVVTIGAGAEDKIEDLYENLLGISSHELFHAWNVCRIRPKELSQYVFSQEIYFETGYVAEGFTTYYGDLMLVRGGVYGLDWYLRALNRVLKRHFLNLGRFNLSVVDSSVDLWLDGYAAGAPNRRSSIYVEGAVVALVLDLYIRLKSEAESSLDDVMRTLWNDFGQTGRGYEKGDIEAIAEKLCGQPVRELFSAYVDGVESIVPLLTTLVNSFGLLLTEKLPEAGHERDLGFRIKTEGSKHLIAHIHPDSSAYHMLSTDDELLEVNGETDPAGVAGAFQKENKLVVKRGTKQISLTLATEGPFYTWYELTENTRATAQEKTRLNGWLGINAGKRVICHSLTSYLTQTSGSSLPLPDATRALGHTAKPLLTTTSWPFCPPQQENGHV